MRKEMIYEAIYVLVIAALIMLVSYLPCHAAVYYVDLDSGNDTTGTGTTGAPWKTILKCTTSGATTGGDECRVAKTAISATTGNLTFTNGSTSVTTASDETGNISAGDYVSLAGTGLVSASDESWWKVASLNASSITLTYEYWGPGTGVAAQGYYQDAPVVMPGTDEILATSEGTSSSNRLKISGGWDLTGPTQDGVTFIDHSAAGVAFMDLNYTEFIEFSNFVFDASNMTTFSWSGKGCRYKDFVFMGYQFILNSGAYDAWVIYENIIISGGPTDGFVGSSSDFVYADGLISYSSGTGSGDEGMVLGGTNHILKNVEIYNASNDGMTIGASDEIYLENVTIDTNSYSGGDCVDISSATNISINNIDCKNIVDVGFNIQSTAIDILITNPTFTSVTGDEVLLAGLNSYHPVNKRVRLVNYNDVAGDDRTYLGRTNGDPYIQRDTADARSGTCMKFWPVDLETYELMTYPIGTFKVTDGSSDVVLYVYLKDDASFNGVVLLAAEANGKKVVLPTEKTMTTSYVQHSITVSSADIATGDYVHLKLQVSGHAGSVYVDDFSASN